MIPLFRSLSILLAGCLVASSAAFAQESGSPFLSAPSAASASSVAPSSASVPGAALAASPVSAQTPASDSEPSSASALRSPLAPRSEVWNGVLEVGGHPLRIVFRLSSTDAGWRGTMDSPDQRAYGIPLDSVAVSPLGVHLASPALRMIFSGGYLGRELLSGVFTQGGVERALVLRRGEAVPPRRPQEPQPPFPYRCEEVAFDGRDGAATLHGTLTLPAGEGPFPALVLVTGSGTQNRDEEVFGHKPFLVLADFLTRRGVAVLRYDDRSYGASREEQARLQGTTTLDLTEDALGAFDFLRSHGAIDSARIGIGGHSEGGTIALFAAAREPRVAFVVSLAGMFVRGAELLAEQNRAALVDAGVPQETADAYGRALERLYAAWIERTPAELAAQRTRLLAEATAGEALPEPLRRNLDAVIDAAQQPWFDRFVRLDPSEAAARLGDRPCLALNGAKDRQVDAAQNLGRLQRLTQGRPAVETIRYEGLNHLFQPCTTGAVSEYAAIETTISPAVLADLAAWLQRTTQR